MKIFVKAIKCNYCGDIIYSRANHDFYRCSCERTFVDGGNQTYCKLTDNTIQGYYRYGCEDLSKVERVVIELGEFNSIEEAQTSLFRDWNTNGGTYGKEKSRSL